MQAVKVTTPCFSNCLLNEILANILPLLVHMRFLFIFHTQQTQHTHTRHTHANARTRRLKSFHQVGPASSSTRSSPKIYPNPFCWLWCRNMVDRNSGNLRSPFMCVTDWMTRHLTKLERVMVCPAVHHCMFDLNHSDIQGTVLLCDVCGVQGVMSNVWCYVVVCVSSVCGVVASVFEEKQENKRCNKHDVCTLLRLPDEFQAHQSGKSSGSPRIVRIVRDRASSPGLCLTNPCAPERSSKKQKKTGSKENEEKKKTFASYPL